MEDLKYIVLLKQLLNWTNLILVKVICENGYLAQDYSRESYGVRIFSHYQCKDMKTTTKFEEFEGNKIETIVLNS